MAEENIAEQIIEDIEDVFHPKSGGMIDRHRQEKARREAAQKEAENAAERIEENASFAVKVTHISPETISAITYNVLPGGMAPILPNSPYRYRATIFVVTPAVSVTLAKDQGTALSNTGFVLPSGIMFPVFTRAQIWAYNGGASTIQVSVLSEIYAPEK